MIHPLSSVEDGCVVVVEIGEEGECVVFAVVCSSVVDMVEELLVTGVVGVFSAVSFTVDAIVVVVVAGVDLVQVPTSQYPNLT